MAEKKYIPIIDYLKAFAIMLVMTRGIISVRRDRIIAREQLSIGSGKTIMIVSMWV